jgi:hypothetical protein
MKEDMENMEERRMIDLVKYRQNNPVNSEVEALFSVSIPILRGILYSLNRDIVEEVGGYDKISLLMLSRLYREGDGDCGICFEYAVHDAIINNNPSVLDRIDTALTRFCKIKNGDPTSILFGAEKNGAMQLIDSIQEHLTDESTLLPGTKGKPIKLKKHIQGVINAFRKPSEREKLPNSINGLWKADLFVGKAEPDKWIGTTVKINRSQLEAAKGLRMAIVPAKQGKKDSIYVDDIKNLVVCPLPYDHEFTEIFYRAWILVKTFLNSGAKMPAESHLALGADRFVCSYLVDRNKYSVLEVLDAMEVIKQPELIATEKKEAIIIASTNNLSLNTLVAPISVE